MLRCRTCVHPRVRRLSKNVSVPLSFVGLWLPCPPTQVVKQTLTHKHTYINVLKFCILLVFETFSKLFHLKLLNMSRSLETDSEPEDFLFNIFSSVNFVHSENCLTNRCPIVYSQSIAKQSKATAIRLFQIRRGIKNRLLT